MDQFAIEGNLLYDTFPALLELNTSVSDKRHRSSQIYGQLDNNRHEIRLLRFASRKQADRIHCVVEQHLLDDAPPYIALSYAWGGRLAHQRIILNEQTVPVGENLYRFLHHYEVLQRRPDRWHWRWLWIDALCIDQESMKEREHQVSLMTEIYSNAVEVLAWLGPTYQDSDAAMKALARNPTRWGYKKCYIKFWKSIGGLGLVHLCKRSYWSRLWTFQELRKATKITLMCGDRTAPWNNFESFLLHAECDPYYLQERHERARISVLDSPAVSRLPQRQIQYSPGSLYDLMQYTKHLKCSEPRDKVYALLGVIGSDITPDYDRPLGVLANLVLRRHHQSSRPSSCLEAVLDECQFICDMLKIDLPSMFEPVNGWGLTPLPKANDMRRFPLTVHSYVNSWWAAFYGHAAIETILYDSGRVGENDLAHACKAECSTVVHLLFGKVKPSSNNKEYRHSNAILSYAIKHGRDDIVLCMINQSTCDVNFRDREGRTPLMQAMHCHNQTAISAILNRTDLNVEDMVAGVCRSLDVVESEPEIMQVLRSPSASVVFTNLEADLCMRVLVASIESSSETIASFILTHARNLDLRGDAGATALRMACHRGLTLVVGKLLERGADPNASNEAGDTALVCALHSWIPESIPTMVDQLLRNGADPNTPDHDGNRPLGIAIRKENNRAVSQLLEGGADAAAKDGDGNMAIGVAAMTGDEGLMWFLLPSLTFGANGTRFDIFHRWQKNSRGLTAWDIAANRGFLSICELLTNWEERVALA